MVGGTRRRPTDIRALLDCCSAPPASNVASRSKPRPPHYAQHSSARSTNAPGTEARTCRRMPGGHGVATLEAGARRTYRYTRHPVGVFPRLHSAGCTISMARARPARVVRRACTRLVRHLLLRERPDQRVEERLQAPQLF